MDTEFYGKILDFLANMHSPSKYVFFFQFYLCFLGCRLKVSYCFSNYVYLFLIYFSLLINVLFNADFKNASVFGGRI